jgi:hypothetical protein
MRKNSHFQDSTNDRIRRAGWFDGDERSWQALPMAEREDIAFHATGCAVAYPTWEGPVDCVHTGCQIRRGEIPAIALTNRILRSEAQSGWLRFLPDSRDGRIKLARIYRAIRSQAIETGIYDPWKIPGAWQVMVSSAVQEITN